jgi:hypothetical protein
MMFVRAFDGTDRSDEISKEIVVKGEPAGTALLEKIVKDTLTGKNLPCLFGFVVIVIIILLAVWNAVSGPGHREPVKAPSRPSGRPKKGKKKNRT